MWIAFCMLFSGEFWNFAHTKCFGAVWLHYSPHLMFSPKVYAFGKLWETPNQKWGVSSWFPQKAWELQELKVHPNQIWYFICDSESTQKWKFCRAGLAGWLAEVYHVMWFLEASTFRQNWMKYFLEMLKQMQAPNSIATLYDGCFTHLIS